MNQSKVSNQSFQTIAFIFIVIVINIIGMNFFHRFDLTKNKMYTLSDASKTAVKSLEDKLVVKAFFSSDLPGHLSETKRFTEDILSEYSAYSGGLFHYEFVDPQSDEDLLKEAQTYQIPPMSVQATSKGKIEVREVFLGLSFMYEGEQESIPVVQSTRGLEYDITTIIKKISSQKINKVAIYSVPEQIANPYQQGGAFQLLRQALERDNELVDVALLDPIPNDINTLVFTGVSDSLGTDVLYNLDQFVMNGGNVLIFQDAVDVTMENQIVSKKINSNLLDLLRSYGIKIKDNLIKDSECNSLTVTRKQGIFSIPMPIKFPFFPIVNTMNKENIIVKNLNNLNFVFASEIDTLSMNKAVSFTPLLYSSDHSEVATGPNYGTDYRPYMDRKDLKTMFQGTRKPIAGIFEGTFTSYFKGQLLDDNRTPKEKSETTKILVVSDADFVKDSAGMGMNKGQNANVAFVQNAVDYLAGNELLIGLRYRESQFSPLKEVKPAVRRIVMALNMVLPSLLLIFIGIFNYRKQANRKKMIKVMYEK